MALHRPALLWLLLPIAVFILGATLRGRRVALADAVIRIAAVGCVLVALAGPLTTVAVSGNAAVFVVDRSGSVPVTALDNEARAITAMMDRLAVSTRFGVVAFGGRASIVFPIGETPRDPAQIVAALQCVETSDRDHTNIAMGMRLARAMLTRSGGGQIFHAFGALAEFERDIICERTQAGLAAARARGRMGGRPKKLATPTRVAMARALYDDQTHSIADICETLGISRTTLYRYIRPTRPPHAHPDER